MPKTRSQLRTNVFATTTKAVPPTSLTTSKYFSSKINSTETDEPDKSTSLGKTVIRKTTRKHIIIETEESPTNTNRSSDLSSKKLINKSEKRLDEEISKPPVGWERTYKAIKEYRRNIIAPVDTMGCGCLAEEPSDNITPQVCLIFKINYMAKYILNEVLIIF